MTKTSPLARTSQLCLCDSANYLFQSSKNVATMDPLIVDLAENSSAMLKWSRSRSRSPLHRRSELGVLDVASVERPGWLDQDHLGLVVGTGAVFDAARHDDALAGAHLDDAVAEFDAKPALPDHEELVRASMVMPRELAANLDDLDLLAVDRGDGLGSPLLAEERKFLGKVDLVRHARAGFLARKSLNQSRGWPAER